MAPNPVPNLQYQPSFDMGQGDGTGVFKPSQKGGKWQTVVSNGSGHTLAIDLSKGDLVYQALTENTTIDNPVNPVDGEEVDFLFLNTAGNFTVAWGSAFHSTGGAAPVITVGAKYSLVTYKYNAALSIFFEVSRSLNL
jgi:hypothetical protein